MHVLVLTTVCIMCKNPHTLWTNSTLLFLPPNHSKSCGQLTSTTWVWTCGRQHTSTPSRRFSRFTTRPASSSHRHHRTCVSPVSVFPSRSGSHCLWLDGCFIFLLLNPNQRCLIVQSSDWLLHSPEWKEETRLLFLENSQVLFLFFLQI